MYGIYVRSGCDDEVILLQNMFDIVVLVKDMFCLNFSLYVYVLVRVYLLLFLFFICFGYGFCYFIVVFQRGNVVCLIYLKDMSIAFYCILIEQVLNFFLVWFQSNDN